MGIELPHEVLFFPTGSPPVQPRRPARAMRLAVIGTYPPRRCGIASFTADMVDAIATASPDAAIDVYAMVLQSDDPEADPRCWPVAESDPASYRQAAARIEESQPDAIWLQHEFGIFGGPAGDMVIELLGRVSAPIIVTLHTILEHPDADQRHVIDWLTARAAKLVVMSQQGRKTLESVYGVAPEQIETIHHGVPDRPFGRSEAMRRRLGLAGRKVLLTFGLLSPGKGIETAIAALPAIVARNPDAIYCIAGATHPNLAAREGEAYRERLKAMAADLRVAGNVRWIDRFLETEELLDLVEAADIYITPYSGAGQSTSGTLSYAVALGKAVVSTPYVHARELLAGDHGILFPFGDAKALSAAVADLLADPTKLAAMQRRAYLRGRDMLWTAFAARSLAAIEAVRAQPCASAPEIVPGHGGVLRLCDDTGMFQHSVLAVPDRSHGYCVDDNARALILACRAGPPIAALAGRFAAFIEHAWNPETRRFRNFMGFNRCWLEAAGSEDSCGRVLWALGVASVEGDAAIREWADHLYCKAAGIALEFGSPRALAFAMLGADRHLDRHADAALSQRILAHGQARLMALLDAASRPDWRWFEAELAYDNCRLPEALLRAAARHGDTEAAGAALDALAWVVARQTAPAGHFRPVGSEGFGRTGLPLPAFDQQPVDAWATVDAAALAYDRTGEQRWCDAARAAYAWFWGGNDRGLALADALSGDCFDGLSPRGVNRNQGAELVLALHLASDRMITLEALAGEGHEGSDRRSEPKPA